MTESLGIHELAYPAVGVQHVVDILFVHGFNGDPFSSWTSGNVLWPRDLLQADVPQARILTFGYDARSMRPQEAVTTSIRNAALGMLSSLRDFRSGSNTTSTSLIIVAASLGGLVCKQALVFASSYGDRAFQDSLKGLLFLGTPHSRGQDPDWSKLFNRIANAILPVKMISMPFTAAARVDPMDRLQSDFHSLITNDSLSGAKICCVYEELPTPGIGIVVGRDLARLSGSQTMNFGIATIHSRMTEMQHTSDPSYLKIRDVLRAWCDVHNQIDDATISVTKAEKEDTTTEVSSYLSPEGLTKDVALLMDQGQYDKAEKLQRDICDNLRHGYGSQDSSRVIAAHTNLAAIMSRSNKWEEAAKLQREALENMQNLDERNMIRMSTKINLAFTLINMGALDEAEQLLNEVLALSDQLDQQSILLRTAQSNLATVLARRGNYVQADGMLVSVLQNTKMLLGPDHPDTIIALSNLAIMYYETGRYDKAEPIFQEAQLNSVLILGEDHPQTQTITVMHARTYDALGRFKEAVDLLQILYRRNRRTYGSGHAISRSSALLLIESLRRLGDLRRAIEMEREVLEHAQMVLGDNDPETRSAALRLVKSLIADGQLNLAKSVLQQLVASFKQDIGPEDEQKKQAREMLANWDRLYKP